MAASAQQSPGRCCQGYVITKQCCFREVTKLVFLEQLLPCLNYQQSTVRLEGKERRKSLLKMRKLGALG